MRPAGRTSLKEDNIMTVDRLQSYLDELLAADRQFDAQVVAAFKEKAGDWGEVSEDELKFLAEKVLDRHGDRFVDEAARRDLGLFLMQAKSQKAPWEPILEYLGSIPRLSILLVEAIRGLGWRIFTDGRAPDDYIQQVRREAVQINFRGTLSLAKVKPQALPLEVETALRKVIAAIGGFDFLNNPPEGLGQNEHTVLIKPGVNWGLFGYPTVTSWESVYALTKMCLEEADNRGAKVEVIVGDESGIEIKLWGGTTMANFETTNILHAAVLAGLERAASLEAAEPQKYAGANALLATAQAGHRVTADPEDANSVKMISLAQLAGVRVMAFDEDDVTHQTVPVPGAKHFQDGIEIPSIVADTVTDIINLPKPPGRHLIMGNTGLTGALKNHVGLLKGQKRSPGLHGQYNRYPRPEAGQTNADYIEKFKARKKALLEDKSGKERRKFALDVLGDWGDFAPALPFHEKIVELYLAVAAKERFSVTDMRRTMSSLGPDLGDTIDIGVVLASKDPLTLDVFAGALLKHAYVQIGSFLEAAVPGGDSLLEYLMGKTWLKRGTPFDLMSHIAANSYGVGPVDWDHIDLKGLENSGFTADELEAVISYLRQE
jgi:uncharacterized protein (DUF362 family)